MTRYLKPLAPLAGLLLVSATGPGTTVKVTVDGLRNTRGMIRACLTASPRAFPDCSKDQAARSMSVAAANGAVLEFTGVPAGRYAVSLLHDENANGRMDKVLMMPREGYGFSRDAPVRFGPPPFRAAAFDVAGGAVGIRIHMRYL